MATGTMTSKGQITIPAKVRKALKLKAGDRIEFYEIADGQFAMQPKTGSIKDMKGIFQRLGMTPLGNAPSIEEMDRDILDHAAELDRASMSDAPQADVDDQVA